MKIIEIVLLFLIMNFCGLSFFNFFQLNNYKIQLTTKNEKQFLLISAVTLIFGITISIIYKILYNSIFYDIIFVILLIILLMLYFLPYTKKRNKLVLTKRAIRLILLYNIFAITSIACVLINNKIIFVDVIFLLIFLSPFLSMLALKMIEPFERKNNNKYIKKAKQKLYNDKLLIKIAITGSYGKTSCKNILNTLLSTNYNVYATKNNYNTPLGLCKSINEINPSTDVFIAEMGARKSGDIKELMNMVRPGYGMITGITEQHLETFYTIENIYKEKFELVKNLPENGFCVFNSDNFYANDMYNNCKIRKCKTGIYSDKNDIFADNIISKKENGMEFDLHIKDQKLHCKTSLIGKHNIQNIVLCAGMAVELGVSSEDITKNISKIKAINHRMEIIKSNNILIIDDSYNCNMEGAVAAIEFLKEFDRRKVVYTQGLVEVGIENQKLMNNFLGKLISKVADVVILSGINKEYIKEGLLSEKFEGKIYEFRNLKEVQKNFSKILRTDDILLIQNDLPDNF